MSLNQIKSLGKTQSELADLLGVKQPIVSEWLSGKRRVSVKMALKMEQVFGISRSDIRPDIFGDQSPVSEGKSHA